MSVEERLGTDLALTTLFQGDEWGAHDLTAVPARRGRRLEAATDGGDATDLATLTGRQNLAQQLIVRLLTPLGALADLGHPGYGCRLGELVGSANDDVTRFLARRHVLEALAAEPRARLTDLTVHPVTADQPATLALSLVVQPVVGGDDAGAPVGLTIAVAL
jgi:phage baseplate assembly protein W